MDPGPAAATGAGLGAKLDAGIALVPMQPSARHHAATPVRRSPALQAQAALRPSRGLFDRTCNGTLGSHHSLSLNSTGEYRREPMCAPR